VCILFFFFFFFQAEDGIRDYKVTGVQTCALPISQQQGIGDLAPAGMAMAEPPQRRMASEPRRLEIGEIGLAMNRDRPQLRRGTRSEERRVGKECRARWAPDR